MLDPNTLIPYAKNTKAHPPEQVEAIAKSIKAFGFDQPIVVNKDMVIIKGHGRRLASILLGYTSVPVLVREVSNNEAKFLREVDNHLQSTDWDTANLATELLELEKVGGLELSLFTKDEIPDLAKYELKVGNVPFSLLTNHKCPSCHYEW